MVDAVARDCIYNIEQSLGGVFANFPNGVLRNVMRFLVFPLGRHAQPASDRQTYRLAREVLLAKALRLAAWQFLVKPPRIDNKPQLGVWVRIHFGFGTRAIDEGTEPSN